MDIKTQKIQDSKTQNKSEVKNKVYDLEQRFGNYFEKVILLTKKCISNDVTKRIISQVVASSGSVSANYAEASEAMSKKDFVKCLKICRKEAKETKVWLRGLKIAIGSFGSEFDLLIQESNEIVYILTSIISKNDSKL